MHLPEAARYESKLVPNLVLCNQVRYAGHAKWQNIKTQKLTNDVNKGRTISRYVLMVRKAIILNGRQTDPKLNTKLAQVLAEAQRMSVPKATLERAIVRAANIKLYNCNIEIQGPKLCSIIARCETDNASVLRRDVRKLLKKHDCNLMPDDSLINMFDTRGFVRAESILITGDEIDADKAEEAAIIANAEDVELEEYPEATEDGLRKVWLFKTDSANLDPCKGILEKHNYKVISSDLELVPYRLINFGPEVAEKLVEILHLLKDMEQVLDVFHNVDLACE